MSATKRSGDSKRCQVALAIKLNVHNISKDALKISVLNSDIEQVILTDDQGTVCQHMILPIDFVADEARLTDTFLAGGSEFSEYIFFEPPLASSALLTLTLPARDFEASADSLSITIPASDIHSLKDVRNNPGTLAQSPIQVGQSLGEFLLNGQTVGLHLEPWITQRP